MRRLVIPASWADDTRSDVGTARNAIVGERVAKSVIHRRDRMCSTRRRTRRTPRRRRGPLASSRDDDQSHSDGPNGRCDATRSRLGTDSKNKGRSTLFVSSQVEANLETSSVMYFHSSMVHFLSVSPINAALVHWYTCSTQRPTNTSIVYAQLQAV